MLEDDFVGVDCARDAFDAEETQAFVAVRRYEYVSPAGIRVGESVKRQQIRADRRGDGR